MSTETHATHRAYRNYTTCGDLRAADAGSRVTLRGWVNRRRDHGGLIFIDLRDRYGITQCTINPANAPDAHAAASIARSEFVLEVSGAVVQRPAGAENAHIATGEVELLVDAVTVLNAAKTPNSLSRTRSEISRNSIPKRRSGLSLPYRSIASA